MGLLVAWSLRLEVSFFQHNRTHKGVFVNKGFWGWVSLGAGLLLVGPDGWAEETARLEEVVVTATKVEQTTAEAPSNVSVVTAKDIENSNVVRLGDALTAKVPSLYLRGGAVGTTSRDVGVSVISLRGAYGSRTKVLLDGVASLADANSANLNLSLLPLGDVERVEIVPGVSSSLYGSDAIGGVINVITKVPTKREFSGRVVRGFADGDRTTVEGAYRDKWANGLGLSFSFYHQEMGGYDKNEFVTVSTTPCGTCTTPVTGWGKTTDNTGATKYIVGDKGAVSSISDSVSGTLFFDLSSTSKIKTGITHFKNDSGQSPYNLYLNTTLPAKNLLIDGGRLASLTEYSFLTSQNQREETRYFAGYEGQMGNYQLKLDASYFDRKYSYETANVGSFSAAGAGTLTETPNTTTDLSAQLGFPVGERHYLVSGIAFNRQSLNRKVYGLSFWREEGAKTTLNDQGDGYSNTYSVYLQDQLYLTPALTLYVGARYDDWKSHGFIAKWVGGVTPPRDVPEHGDSALSPRVAAVYKLTNAVSLKASAGTAFRAPTLYDMYAADTVFGSKISTTDPNLKPERAKAVDVGTEINFPSGANFKAAVFYTRITDMIYAKEVPYTGPYTPTIPATVTIHSQKTNAAEGTTKGIELSGDFPITGWLKGSASYTWTDARITKDDSGAGLLGKMLVYVPKNMANFGLQANYRQWSGNLSTTYTGLTYANATNSDVVKDVFGGNSKFWLTDLKVGYQLDKRTRASLVVSNLFDEKYYQYYLMPGRNVAIELAARF
jgi:iron complex outermembrane receptor protein